MRLAKMTVKAFPIACLLAVLSTVVSSAYSLPTEPSESKDGDRISLMTAIAEEPKDTPEFPDRVSINLIVNQSEVPLGSFDEIELLLDTTETEKEIPVDETDEALTLEEDDDPDPLSYYYELPDPDWSVVPLDQSLVETILYESYEHRVDPCVVIALIQSESGFYTDVVSSAGCYGLMQLHPLYYPEDLKDPYRNIHYGVETIGNNLEKCDGNYIYALSMYANGYIGTDFSYQYDVMERAELWRQTLRDAFII